MPSFDLKDYGVQLYQLEAHLGLLLLNKKDNTLHFAKDNDLAIEEACEFEPKSQTHT